MPDRCCLQIEVASGLLGSDAGFHDLSKKKQMNIVVAVLLDEFISTVEREKAEVPCVVLPRDELCSFYPMRAPVSTR